MTPWEALCVNLIRPYTLKSKDGSQIDFMCLTMIDPASSWFEMVELPVMEFITPSDEHIKGTKTHKHKIILTKLQQRSVALSTRHGLVGIHVVKTLFMIMEANSNFTSKPYVTHMASSISRPVSKTLKQMLYWNMCIKLLCRCSTLLKSIWPIQ